MEFRKVITLAQLSTFTMNCEITAEQFCHTLNTCQICGLNLKKPAWKHVQLVHHMSKYEYSFQFLVHPCACGCGQTVMPQKDGAIGRFIKGHFGYQKVWTEQDIDLLRHAYEHSHGLLSKELLNRFSKQQCRGKAAQLGLARLESRRSKVNKLSTLDAAYIAGILDSDGCIAYRSNNRYSRKFSVDNTDRRLIDWLLDKIGTGTISSTPGSKSKQEAFRYNLDRQVDVYKLLLQIEPFVQGRKQRVKETIEIFGERYDGEAS